MSENRRQILGMLASGKITTDEAEALLAALGKGESTSSQSSPQKSSPKYLRVLVESDDTEHGGGPTKVNIRVPIQLLRAGVKLASLIPAQAQKHVDDALKEHGMAMDLSSLKPENLEVLIDHMNDLTVDVDETHNKVRIFCE